MKIRKLICLVLTVVFMTSILNIPIVAYDVNSTKILIGQIMSNEKLDLSNIKIDILSSTLDFNENGVLIYANTYQYSVYTDENGYYRFSKPSEKYLISIDTSTLPDATGVDTNSIFVDTDDSVPTIELSEITDITIDGDDSVILYNKDKEEIISNVIVDNVTSNASSRNAVLNDVTVNANGIIETKTFSEDISKYSLLEKADILFDANAITEKRKAEMYLEAYKTSNTGDADCLTRVYDYLFDYYVANKGTILADNIGSLLKLDTTIRSATRPYTFTNEGTLTTTVGSGDSAIKYKIHYEKSSTETSYMNNPSTILSYVTDIATYYYLTYNFNRPQYETGENEYHIYFYPMSGSVNGSCHRKTTGSYISINYPPSSNTANDIKKTISHEMFHSIQYTYNNHNSLGGWFSEASATWAGLEYINAYLPYARRNANKYLSTTNKRLTDLTDNRNYGAFLFPKYISQKYGGVTTIRKALEYFQEYGVYTALEKAAQSYSNTITYGELFSKFQSYNADTRKYDNYTDGTNRYQEATRVGTNKNYTSSGSILSTAARFYDYTATSSTTSKITFNINLTSGNYKNARFRVIKYPDNGAASTLIATYTPTSDSITIVSNNFKTGTSATAFSRITLAAVNIATDTSSYVFSLTRTVE